MIPIAAVLLPRTGIRSFGFQRAPTTAHPGGHVHNGIDLPAEAGTNVYAARGGLVRFATSQWQQGFTGYGNVVVIAHDDGTYALYAHLRRPLVIAGEPVSEGDLIGEVGTTQYAAPAHTSHFAISAAHLHFEVSATPYPQESTAPRIDPVAWLEGTPIVDVPLDPDKTPKRYLRVRDLQASDTHTGSTKKNKKL